MKRSTLLLSSAFLLCFNGAYAEPSSSDAELIETYKQNFMKSCLEPGNDAQHQSTCNCVLNSVLKNFNASDLKNEKEVTKYIQNVALINCEG